MKSLVAASLILPMILGGQIFLLGRTVSANARTIEGRVEESQAALPMWKVHNLAGSTFASRAMWADASACFDGALKERRKLGIPEGHTDAVLLNNVATGYLELSKYDPAEKLYRQALSDALNIGTGNEICAATCLINLGELYRRQHNLNEAEQCITQAIGWRECFLGLNHPSTVSARADLSAIYQEQKRKFDVDVLFPHVHKMQQVLEAQPRETLMNGDPNAIGELYMISESNMEHVGKDAKELDAAMVAAKEIVGDKGLWMPEELALLKALPK